jgi:uncharacterized protein (TIGR02646 family)
MRRVFKKPSPALTDFLKNEEHPVYEGGLDKEEKYRLNFFKIRQQLAEEQGYICCYCQQRIDIKEGIQPLMKLEHFKPKNRYPELSLDYKNFLAACLGNTEGQTHCDSCKSGKELENIPNPASKEFEHFKIRYIRYERVRAMPNRRESDKYVLVVPYSEELQKNDPLTGINAGCLNLNHQTLKSRRGSAWKGVLNIFRKKCGDEKDWHTEKGQQIANELIKAYEMPNNDGQLREFCQVIIDVLKEEFLSTHPHT